MPDDAPPPPRILWIPSDRVWIDPQLVGRNIVTQFTDVAIDPVTPVLVAPANPMRWAIGFVFAPPVMGGAVVGPFSDLTTGTGFTVPQPGLLWYHLTTYASLVQLGWYGVGGAGSVVRVIEELRQ